MEEQADQYKQIQQARDTGKKIGLVQGSWDMLHLGHICYLQEARKTCDYLVVAMDDDEKVQESIYFPFHKYLTLLKIVFSHLDTHI